MKHRDTYKGISKQRCIILLIFTVFISIAGFSPLSAQNVGINNTGAAPNKSAVVDLSPNTSGGFLLPTVTSTQLSTITVAPNGTLIFNSTTNCMEVCYSNTWQNVICPCSGAPAAPTISGPSNLTASTTGYVFTATSAGATSFTWTVPASVGTITSGQGTSSITVTAAASSGSGNITATATNSCGTSASSANYSVTVTATCTEVITLDASVQSGNNVNTLTIATTGTKELVIVACNGWSSALAGMSGSVAVSGPGSPAVNFYQEVYSLPNYDAVIDIYWFVAATAGTYNITVNEGNLGSYYNYAVALTGFCSTPSASNFKHYVTNTSNSGANSLSATLTEDANSYAFGSFTNDWSSSANNPTWTNLTGLQFNNDPQNDNTIGGKAISGATSTSITATDAGGSLEDALILIDIQ